MGLADSITASKKVGLDSNIFILASPSSTSHLSPPARNLLSHLQKVSPQVFISVLVFEEFFVKVYKLGQEKDIPHLTSFLTMNDQAQVIDVNRDISLLAAKIRAQYPSVRTPDAFHLATAISVKAHFFITTDRRLPKKIGRLSVVCLTQSSPKT